MKKSFRLLAVLMLAATLLCGCAEEATYAIMVGDQEVSKGDYERNVELYLDDSAKEDPEAFREKINALLINQKLYALQYDELGLILTKEEEEAIQTTLSEMVSSYGGMSQFNLALESANYTYDEYLRELYDQAKKTKVLDYYFGEEGQTPVKDQELMDYYRSHHALIRYAAVSTLDGQTHQKLDEDGLKEAKATAQRIFDEATEPSATDRFPEIISVYSEDDSTQYEGKLLSDEEPSEVTARVMKMKVGEVVMLETDEGYMIIKRYDALGEEPFTDELRQSVLEKVRKEEIKALLAKWQEEAEIEINETMIEQYPKEEKGM